MSETTIIVGVLEDRFGRLDGFRGCLDTAWTAFGQHLDKHGWLHERLFGTGFGGLGRL